MYSKTCKIVLLVIALVAMIWPDLLGVAATFWVGLIAVTLLLIAELSCDNCEVPMKSHRSAPARKTNKRKTSRKKKRR
jgi:hypothetical protein